jgi:hypothetical protein
MLFLACWLYASVAFMGTLPASPFVIGTTAVPSRLILSFVACVFFLILTIPVLRTPPLGGHRIRLVALGTTTVLTLAHLWSQTSLFLKGGHPPLHVKETVLSVGGDLAFLLVVWVVWVIARLSGYQSTNVAVGWLLSFYFICIGGTSFEYSGP